MSYSKDEPTDGQTDEPTYVNETDWQSVLIMYVYIATQWKHALKTGLSSNVNHRPAGSRHAKCTDFQTA